MILLKATNLRKTLRITSIISEIGKARIPRQQPTSISHISFVREYVRNTLSHVLTLNNNSFSFSNEKPEKTSLYLIKSACEQLNKIDTILLDNLCIAFGSSYIIKAKLKDEKIAKKNEDSVKESLQSLLKKEEKQSAKVDAIFKNLSIVFQFLNASKVGFLRGDLHSRTFYELQKDISQKIKGLQLTQKRQEIQYKEQDFKNLLNLVTESARFRIPKQGIYKRQLQSKINLYHRQILLQEVSNTQSHQRIEQILESLIKLNKIQQAQVIRKFMIEWLVPITGAIKEEQQKCNSKQLQGPRKHYGEYLLKMNAQKLATAALTQLIIQTFETICRQGSIEQFQIQDYEGILQDKYIKEVLKKFESQIAYQREERIFKETQKEYDLFIKNQEKNKTKKKNFANDNNMDIENDKPDNEEGQRFKYWTSEAFKQKEKSLPYKYVKPGMRKEFLDNMVKRICRFRKFKQQIPDKARLQLGNLIVYLLKQLLKIQNKYGYKVPLLIQQHKTFKDGDKYSQTVILRLNQHFLQTVIPKLQKNQDMFIHMERSVPTIIEPLPWLQPQIGGYYSQATNVMRFSHCPIQERLIKYADNHRIFNVLNYLSRIPWKINQDVLKIVEQVWAQGGQKSYIPKRYSELINPYMAKLKLESDYKTKIEIEKKIQRLRDEHSQRSDFLLKLNIAQTYSKLDHFYFPHNLDFRGRVYPIPPHMNHIGHDLARGLLLFGVGKRLGQSGVRWLKIHTANLMGKDKASIEDKLAFVEANIDLIHKFAQAPMKNRQWFQFEDCWQAISSIIDLSNALKSKNPEDYVSYLHIHQDGSCNGLQHYAALGRDIEGAYQVNLGPGEKPSDIYTHVSKMVIKMINEDIATQGLDVHLHALAKKLPDNIKRKTIKQTVMTSVYGVTFIGARQQIYRQLTDQDFLAEDQAYLASLYMAKLTLKAISNLFTGAHQIKTWLRTCANIISKTGNPVGWITPLGLPIVQPYRKESKVDIIKIVSHRMQVPKEIQNIPISTSKQTSAFPPNFIHSLDSSHMMYTAEVCQKSNLTFAAVHDSYWTHAGTVEDMNRILREQFIKLHSEPLLENFKKSLENRYPEVQFPEIPKRGEFDLTKVKESLYFFS